MYSVQGLSNIKACSHRRYIRAPMSAACWLPHSYKRKSLPSPESVKVKWDYKHWHAISTSSTHNAIITTKSSGMACVRTSYFQAANKPYLRLPFPLCGTLLTMPSGASISGCERPRPQRYTHRQFNMKLVGMHCIDRGYSNNIRRVVFYSSGKQIILANDHPPQAQPCA